MQMLRSIGRVGLVRSVRIPESAPAVMPILELNCVLLSLESCSMSLILSVSVILLYVLAGHDVMSSGMKASIHNAEVPIYVV